MHTHESASWRERARRQVRQLRDDAREAWAAAVALRETEPSAASELMLKAHNLEVTASGIARNLEADAAHIAS